MEQLQYLNNIQFNGDKRLLKGKIKLIKKTVVKIVKSHKKQCLYINFNLISDDELLEININNLKHNYYTDVITFNYSDYSLLIEGDSYISIDRIVDHSSTYNVTPFKELLRVIIHSTLHLCGLNDQTKQEKEKMTKQENKFLKLFHEEHNS